MIRGEKQAVEIIRFILLLMPTRRLRFRLKKELAKYSSQRQKDILMSRKNFNFPANFPLIIASSTAAPELHWLVLLCCHQRTLYPRL